MWEPADKGVIPTGRELKLAMEGIETKKKEIEDAVAALAVAQARVNELRKDLERRIAWVAPIRRLNTDALSLIFIAANEVDWEASMRIAGVSQLWRRTILGTPRAWSFINLSAKTKKGMKKLYLERSSNTGIHLLRRRLPPKLSPDFYRNYSSRLSCLRIDSFRMLPVDLVFPRLERLEVSKHDLDPDNEKFKSIFDHSRFPALRHFTATCEGRYLSEVDQACFDFGDQKERLDTTPVQLQYLSVLKGRYHGIFHLMSSTALTLVCMQIYLPQWTSPFFPPLALPSLEHLDVTFQSYCSEAARWPSDLHTPKLKSLVQANNGLTIAHRDVDSLTHLRVLGSVGPSPPELSPNLAFPSLLVFQARELPSSVVEDLIRNVALYPSLEKIQVNRPSVYGRYTDDISTRVQSANACRREPVIFVLSDVWQEELPGQISRTCGEHHSCSLDE